MNIDDLFLKRKSHKTLIEPIPNENELNKILRAGLQVPDHRNLRPFRFVVVKDEGLIRLSTLFYEALIESGETSELKLERAKSIVLRAPMIIVALNVVVENNNVPIIEQRLTTGCALLAMHMYALSLGYGSIWRTGVFTKLPLVRKRFNLKENDDIVGFLYLGTPANPSLSLAEKNLDINDFVDYL